MKIFLLLLSFCFPLLAVDSIYTWGYGEDIYEMLMSVRHLVGGMGDIEKSAIAVALAVMIYKLYKGASTFDSFFSPLLFVVLFTSVMFAITKTYIIEDEVSGYTHTINDVPLGSGEPLSLFSTLERVLGKGMEAAFSTPNSLHFTEIGYGFGMEVNLKMTKVRPIDPYLVRTFNEYIDNCLMPDIIIGATSEAVILRSTDLLTDLRVTGWQTLAYSDTYPTGRELSCQDTYDLYIAPSVVIDTLSHKLRLADSMGIDTTKLDNGMEAMSNVLYGAAKSSEVQIQQAVLKNMFDEGLMYYAQINGIDMAALATGKALMDNTTQSQWLLAGLAAKEYLPMLKSTLTIILGAITPFVILLAVATLQLQYIKTLIYLYLTLALTTPILTILNHMMYVRVERNVSPYLSADGGFTLLNAVQFSDDLQSYLNWLGFLGTLAPLIAYSIVKGSEQGFVAMFNALGGATGGGVSTGANQMGTANYSHGSATSGQININDQVGSHSAIGSNMKTQKLGYMASQQEISHMGGEEYKNIKTQTGSTISLDSNGEAVNYENRAIQAATTSSMNASLGKAQSNLESVGEQFANTIGSSFGSQFMRAHSVNDMDSLSKSLGLSSGTSKALASSADQAKTEAIREAFSNDEMMRFAKEASAHTGINFKSGNQVLGWLAEKSIGLSIDAGGKISVTGSDGETFSFSTSGETARNLQESFRKSFSRELRENEGLTKDLATQIVNQSAYSDTNAYNEAKNYTKTLAEVEQLQKQKTVAESMGANINKDLSLPILKQIIADDENLRILDKTHPERAKIEADDIINRAGRGDSVYAQDKFNNALKKVTGGWDIEEMESRIGRETASIPDSLGVKGAISNGRSSIGGDGGYIQGERSTLKTAEDNAREFGERSREFEADAQKDMNGFEDKHKDRSVVGKVLGGQAEVTDRYINAKDDGVIPINNELREAAATLNLDKSYGADGNIKNLDGETIGTWSRKGNNEAAPTLQPITQPSKTDTSAEKEFITPTQSSARNDFQPNTINEQSSKTITNEAAPTLQPITQPSPLTTTNGIKDLIKDVDELKEKFEDQRYEKGSRADFILNGKERS